MSLLRGLLGLLLAVLLLWLGGFLQFTASLPETEDRGRQTDAIVVLTGGASRLDVGLELLADGRARRLLISGVDRDTTAAALQARSGNNPEMFTCCVDLGHDAADTTGNAQEAARWLAEGGFRSVRLVTAAYHMPRSLLLFRALMPALEIVPHPVHSPHVRLDAWWRYPGTARLLASEYSKYLVSLMVVRSHAAGLVAIG